MNPINPDLYASLQDAFGDVVVANEGEAGAPVICRDAVTGRPRLDRSRSSFGEYYRVCCPMCRDTRHRLWINHMYNTEKQGVTFKHLIVCYNEHCEQSDGFYEWFDLQLSGYTRTLVRTPLRAPDKPAQPKKIQLPYDYVPLAALPETHSARQYILARDFDPQELSSEWAVGWSNLLAPFYKLRNRLIIPTYELKGKKVELLGWQARHIDPNPPKDAKKYINAPGMKKALTLFNAWRAKDAPWVVVTEGPFDAMRVGPSTSVALFGKTASANQKRILWDVWGAAGKPIIVMLDFDAASETEGLYEEFSRYTQKIYKIDLPEGQDAGSMPKEDIHMRIAQTLKESKCL